MLSKQRLMELREKAKALDPVMRIGKNGMTDGAVEQARKALAKRGLIKIKMLQSFTEEHDRAQAAEELVKRTGAELVSLVGFSVTLHKEMGGREERRNTARPPSALELRRADARADARQGHHEDSQGRGDGGPSHKSHAFRQENTTMFINDFHKQKERDDRQDRHGPAEKAQTFRQEQRPDDTRPEKKRRRW